VKSRLRLLTLAFGISAVLFTAGCGGGSSNPSAASLISAMKAAVNGAQSVHISGTVVVQNKIVKIDMSLTRSGELSGTVTDGSASYDLLVTNGQMYVAPNLAYLKLQGIAASYCPVLCGKFADVGTSAPSSLSMSTIFDTAFKHLNPDAMTVTGKKIVNGQSAWVLTASDGTGFIAAHGKPYLLRATASGLETDFTQWNSVTIPGPPPPSQMVDESKLPG
jgi:hypothetical protein